MSLGPDLNCSESSRVCDFAAAPDRHHPRMLGHGSCGPEQGCTENPRGIRAGRLNDISGFSWRPSAIASALRIPEQRGARTRILLPEDNLRSNNSSLMLDPMNTCPEHPMVVGAIALVRGAKWSQNSVRCAARATFLFTPSEDGKALQTHAFSQRERRHDRFTGGR
jgi:hypothetical protein